MVSCYLKRQSKKMFCHFSGTRTAHHLDAVLKRKRHVATQLRGRPRCSDGVALSRVVVPDRRASTDDVIYNGNLRELWW